MNTPLFPQDEVRTKLNVRTLENDKDYFAAYLNMARHNAFITLSSLSKKFDVLKTDNEGNLASMKIVTMLNSVQKPEQVLKAVRFIDKRFPFLKPIFASEQHYVNNKDENKGKNPDTDKDYNEVIKAFLSALNELRNCYSHVDHKPFEVSVELERYLDKILEAAVRVAKQRNTFTDEEVNHLVKYKYKEDKRSRTFERFINPAFKYPFIKEDRTFTEHGIAFFVCLFLEKQYISEFLGQLKGYKDRRERDFRATIETYKVFTLDVPYDRIESSEPRFALALDMLNDLKRCPDDLFEQLNKINKDYFRVRNTSSEEQVEEVINNEVHPDSLLQKRYNDRFPFFALSYLDQMDAFKFTRFQVDMGNYFYQFYQKEMVDSDSRLRSVGTSLNGFGKPAELNTARLEKWKDLIVTNPPVDYDKPYITDTKPHYHFVNDTQIGLRFAGSEGYYLPPINEDGTELEAPEAWLSIYELPALLFFCWLTQNNDKYAAELVIQDYVKQVRKLFSDISLGKLLPQQNRTQAERILLPYNIEFVNLPNDIKNYLIGKKVDRTAKFTAHARRITDLFVHQTQRLLDKIEKDINTIKGKGNKYGKKKYVEIKSGVLADFLVKDIIRLQPSLSVDNKNKKDGRDKLTGPNFQVLQAQLAFYGRDYKSLKSTFTRSGLIGGNNPHPFLHKINTDTITDIVSFYIEYLKKRKEYFAVCLREANFASYYFLKQNQLKWSNSPRYYSDLAERYNKLPVNLPRGLFLDELRLWFSENGSQRMKELVVQPQKVNTIFLLQKYAEFELNDQSQEFYAFKRTYKCANKLEGTKVGNKTTSVYYSSFDLANKINGWKRRIKALPPKPEKPRPYDSRLYKEPMMAALHDLTEIEKRIRFTRAQDILQFILAREILLSDKEKGLQIGNENEDFKLEFITPQSDRGPLSVSVPCELTVCGKTITDRVKIKNYGNFVRAAQDRRIPDLFQYFTNATESMDNLKKELNAYDDVRLVIMKLVHNFEHKMWATLNAEIHTEKQRQKDITDAMEAELKHITDAKERNKKKKIIANRRKNETYTNFETIRTVFANKLPQHKADCEELKRIRNAFMHNQYPRPQDVTLNLTEADKLCLPAVAKHIGNRAEQLVCTFIDLLNSLTTKR